MTPVRPLDGITVVSLEHAIAAPFCTRQLADLGARIIKVERPGSGDFARAYDERVDGLASHFVWTNRGKESLALDVKDTKARKAFEKILATADVLVQNLAPGASSRLGLDYATLNKLYPRLIVCDISGYGIGGPYEQKKAYDLLIQSESGFLSITGSEVEFAKAGNSIADICAGMYAYSSILSALILRDRTGTGSHIDVSMLESLVEWMGYPLYYTYKGANPPPRAGAAHATIYPYGPFPVNNGGVMFGLQNEREWQAFCGIVLKQPDLTQDERFNQNSKRSANRVALKAIIDQEFSKLTKEEATNRLEEANIANAQVNSMDDVWNHEQLKARNRWRQIKSPIGNLPALLPPASNSHFEYAMGAVPALGEHTEALLREFGVTEEAIKSLLTQEK